MEEDLARCIRRAAGGDESAYRDLYARSRGTVVRLLAGFAQLDPDEVEDVIQETFVRAFRALGRLERPAAFEAWLLSIARNRAMTALARKSVATRAKGDLAHELELETAPLPPFIRREREAELVRQFISELPEGPEKETVRLFYLEGTLSAREIAEKLGVGKSAITMRLERFRGRIKRELLRRVLAVQWE